MSIHIIPATSENFDKMKGQKFRPHEREGVVYLKVVMIKPDTMEYGDPETVVTDAPGIILCGDLEKVKAQIIEWFNQAIQEYSA